MGKETLCGCNICELAHMIKWVSANTATIEADNLEARLRKTLVTNPANLGWNRFPVLLSAPFLE